LAAASLALLTSRWHRAGPTGSRISGGAAQGAQQLSPRSAIRGRWRSRAAKTTFIRRMGRGPLHHRAGGRAGKEGSGLKVTTAGDRAAHLRRAEYSPKEVRRLLSADQLPETKLLEGGLSVAHTRSRVPKLAGCWAAQVFDSAGLGALDENLPVSRRRPRFDLAGANGGASSREGRFCRTAGHPGASCGWWLGERRTPGPHEFSACKPGRDHGRFLVLKGPRPRERCPLEGRENGQKSPTDKNVTKVKARCWCRGERGLCSKRLAGKGGPGGGPAHRGLEIFRRHHRHGSPITGAACWRWLGGSSTARGQFNPHGRRWQRARRSKADRYRPALDKRANQRRRQIVARRAARDSTPGSGMAAGKLPSRIVRPLEKTLRFGIELPATSGTVRWRRGTPRHGRSIGEYGQAGWGSMTTCGQSVL